MPFKIRRKNKVYFVENKGEKMKTKIKITAIAIMLCTGFIFTACDAAGNGGSAYIPKIDTDSQFQYGYAYSDSNVPNGSNTSIGLVSTNGNLTLINTPDKINNIFQTSTLNVLKIDFKKESTGLGTYSLSEYNWCTLHLNGKYYSAMPESGTSMNLTISAFGDTGEQITGSISGIFRELFPGANEGEYTLGEFKRLEEISFSVERKDE